MNQKNTLNHSAECPFCGEKYGHKCGEPAGDPSDAYRRKIEPPIPYRPLADNERIIDGDEWFSAALGDWRRSIYAGKTPDELGRKGSEYRRAFKSPESSAVRPVERQSTQPLFEQFASQTINRVTSTFGQRGTEYGDTMRDCQWLVLLATAKKLGYNIDPKHARAIAIGGMVDIKYQRYQGGYKDDNGVDGVAYQCFHTADMANLLGGEK